MTRRWWFEFDNTDNFDMNDVFVFLFWSSLLLSVLACLCLRTFYKFWSDPIYSLPNIRAFMPLLIGNFLMILFNLVAYLLGLFDLETAYADPPQSVFDHAGGTTCVVSYLGYASGHCGVVGLGFTAWVPLKLIRCASQFEKLRVSKRRVARVVAIGMGMGFLQATINYLVTGVNIMRNVMCVPDIMNNTFLSCLSASPFYVLAGAAVYWNRCARLEVEKMGEGANLARLRKKAAGMRRHSLFFAANTMLFSSPMITTTLLQGLHFHIPSKSTILVTLSIYYLQVIGNMALVWIQASVQQRKRNVRMQEIMASYAPVQEKLELDLGELHNRGVSLHFLHWFVKENNVSPHMNVGQVMQQLVKAVTAERKCNYCEYISVLRDNEGRWAVGPPTYFVSHAWGDTFLNLLEQLTLFYMNKGQTFRKGQAATMYFWIDIFAINQHDEGIGADLARMHTVIDKSQAVLLTLNPWNSPQTLTRVWCLWEVLKALQKGREVVPVMPSFEEANFMNTIREDRQKILGVLEKIEVQNARATVASDKGKIFGEIESTVGFPAMNTLIKTNLEIFLKGIAVDRAVASMSGQATDDLTNLLDEDDSSSHFRASTTASSWDGPRAVTPPVNKETFAETYSAKVSV